MQSCSETEQDVHGLLPSHLQSNTISTLSSQRETPHQPRLDTVASCSGDPNLILRARQMSHCQKGQPLTSLCKTERYGSDIKAGTHGVGCPQSLPGRLFGPFGRRRNVLVIIHRHGQEWAVCRLGSRSRIERVTRRRVALGRVSTDSMILDCLYACFATGFEFRPR